MVVNYATLKTNSTMLNVPQCSRNTSFFHTFDRPDTQIWTGRCTSGLTCPTIKHLALLTHIARYLVDNMECAWQFPVQKVIDADWASNEDDRRSVDAVPLGSMTGNEHLHTASGSSQSW